MPLGKIPNLKGAKQMQAQAYEGYFEGGNFYTAGKSLHIPERRKVYITIFNESVHNTLPAIAPDWLGELHQLL